MLAGLPLTDILSLMPTGLISLPLLSWGLPRSKHLSFSGSRPSLVLVEVLISPEVCVPCVHNFGFSYIRFDADFDIDVHGFAVRFYTDAGNYG